VLLLKVGKDSLMQHYIFNDFFSKKIFVAEKYFNFKVD